MQGRTMHRKVESTRLLLLVPATVFLLAGCIKPGAQIQCEALAQQIRAQPGCADNLRQWFDEVRTNASPNNAVPLRLPESLRSGWWSGAKASAVWSGDGSLLEIIARKEGDFYGPILLIGAPSATLQTLSRGEIPKFSAQVTNGVFACIVFIK